MSFFSIVRERMNSRKDSEHQQAFLRLFIVSIVSINVFFKYGFASWDLESSAGQALFVCTSSLAISFLIIAHIIYLPAVNVPRRIVGMIQDVLAITATLYLNGDFATVYLFVYPFITIGNGFRYGVKYLIACSLMSLAGLGWLFTHNEFWSKNIYITLGLIINFLLVAFYTAYLLHQLHKATTKLQKMATHDQLTDLPNRQMFEEMLSHTILMNARQNKFFGCLYFDLDGFKKVNDDLGHQYGDFLLQAVAEKVKECIRDSDLFSRLGGDEFAIILDPLHSHADAELVAQRIISSVETLTYLKGKPIKVSVSVGCVLIPPQTRLHLVSSPEIVTQADENMYKSKKAGKGTYTISDFKRVS